MEKEKLYRLMDVIDEIKQIDELISKHEQEVEVSSLMIDQYKSRKEQLLTYSINEINTTSNHRSSRLSMIRLMMERFYPEIEENNQKTTIQDKNLSSLAKALLAS